MLNTALSRLSTTGRAFSTTRHIARGRNVLAKYARPANIPPRLIPSGAQDAANTFETAATEPVAPSLQEVPPPDTASTSKIAAKLPAMEPVAFTDDAEADKVVPDDEKAMKVAGVAIPAKPIPPGEEECCMSGCVHCVYTIYADDMEAYTEALKDAKSALEARHTPVAEWPTAVAGLVDGQSGGAGDLQKQKEDTMKNVDPSLAAFLALENKLKQR